ncbi:unnamed protein product, partial [Mesorhabditis belari]|uniref:SH3 domain-containing protein n=1 Tax=Mesorhabditis belari TaxID=2138241 RepID=A0AAF3JC00_9BILA
MSKQPVRVVAAPQQPTTIPQRIPPTVHVPPNTGRSYNDMMEIAERQRKQIEANRVEEERRTKARTVGGDVRERLQQKQRGVAEGEMELQRLRELEQATNALRHKNNESKKMLGGFQVEFENQEAILRQVCTRVFGLRAQVEELRRRKERARADAAEVNRVVQTQLQVRQHHQQKVVKEEPPQIRPRASVEPFNVQLAKQLPSEEVKKNIIDRRVDVEYNQTPLMVCPPADDTASESSQSTVPSPPAPPREKAPSPSPSPPKDPHPSNPPPIPPQPSEKEIPLPVVSLTSAKASLSVTIERPSTLPHEMIPEKTTIPASSSTIPSGDPMEEVLRLRQSRTDLVSLRPHSLQATKRRSWAASESSTMPELDAIKRAILDAQKRGETHFAPQVSANVTVPKIVEPIAEETNVLAPVKEIDEIRDAATDEESTETKSDEESTKNMEIEIAPEKKVIKGILRPLGLKKEPRRIEFDPLALLLDAALEGEMDLVVSCAKKAANDEGITALHNAICAGHYEIVRFLIDKHADVNAQDSDGWTPLHCAASCNNLPMVRLLVEGGACLLAATLSDMETPIEKCEEEEDGYDGCLNYMLSAHNATGVVNGGKIYAAYSYDAQYEDELSFEGGDELRVLQKDDEEKGWWRCEQKLTDGSLQNGLCPRTYLSLYPAIKYRQKLNFVPFQIPNESNNNAAEKLGKPQ